MRDPLHTFAANLRRIREESGFSQEKLALESGLSMGHVSKIDRGDCEPGVRTVSKLARGLGVSVAALFEGIDGEEGP
ncbi:MAG: DNA-binding protein [Solirubrobacterales bacterium]|jgi:transcriptional regulator with XRE-family HTH domain|nr:DNA-binding protein [Solirubrobacterales bacterium]